MDKLGLIAGAGALPVEVARECLDAGRPLFVLRIKGLADERLNAYPGADVGLAELGKAFKALKAAKCKSVCFGGIVKRPDFRALKPDLKGLALLPGIVMAARQGDDGLLRAILRIFEKEGFRVEGVHEVAGGLTLPTGALGAHLPAEGHQTDIARALDVAREIGRLDIGQGAVVARGLVLAVEAQEGTDAMLRRCAELPSALRGTPDQPCGVLAKAPKPIQERRVDLPTIGLATVHRAAAAGLAGIVGETGGVLVLDREAVIAEADALGLFIIGVDPGPP
jgi:UDP-2,3-diacylglucosamine hydrolase